MRYFVICLSVILSYISLTLPGYVWGQTQPAGSATPGYVMVEEDGLVTLADKPRESFRAAVAAFLNRDLPAAAADIRKGAAFLKLETGRAGGEAKKALMGSVQELEKLAGEVQQGDVADLKKLQNAFARAEHALAGHHYVKALELKAGNLARKSGRELQAAADYVHSSQAWLSRKMHAGADATVNKARRVGAKMAMAAGATAKEVGESFTELGEELDELGREVAGLQE